VICSDPVDLDRTVQIKRGGGSPVRSRFPASKVQRGSSGSTPVMFRRLLSDVEITTSFRTTRGSRELDRHHRLLAEGGEGYSWSCAGRQCASVSGEALNSLRIERSMVVREMRQRKTERIGGEGGVRVHRGR
jgi:hypothetical protein